MSFRSGLQSTFKASSVGKVSPLPQLDQASADDVNQLLKHILDRGVHGFCFSLYEEGQKPGDVVEEDQIRRRMDILRPS